MNFANRFCQLFSSGCCHLLPPFKDLWSWEEGMGRG